MEEELSVVREVELVLDEDDEESRRLKRDLSSSRRISPRCRSRSSFGPPSGSGLAASGAASSTLSDAAASVDDAHKDGAIRCCFTPPLGTNLTVLGDERRARAGTCAVSVKSESLLLPMYTIATFDFW